MSAATELVEFVTLNPWFFGVEPPFERNGVWAKQGDFCRYIGRVLSERRPELNKTWQFEELHFHYLSRERGIHLYHHGPGTRLD